MPNQKMINYGMFSVHTVRSPQSVVRSPLSVVQRPSSSARNGAPFCCVACQMPISGNISRGQRRRLMEIN